MSEENKVSLDENGDIKVNDDLLNDIAGGTNPEDQDDECKVACTTNNCNCKVE